MKLEFLNKLYNSSTAQTNNFISSSEESKIKSYKYSRPKFKLYEDFFYLEKYS